MARAGASVERLTTSPKGIPRFSIFDMADSMAALGRRALCWCMSELIVSGPNPCCRAGAAMRNQKLNAPCPRSKRMPRCRASHA
jgi:hypothetical protein